MFVLLKRNVAQMDLTFYATLGEQLQRERICFDVRDVGPPESSVVRPTDWALESIVVKDEYFRWIETTIREDKNNSNDTEKQVDVTEIALLHDTLKDVYHSDYGEENSLKKSHLWSRLGLEIKNYLVHWLFDSIDVAVDDIREESNLSRLAPQTALSSDLFSNSLPLLSTIPQQPNDV